MAVQSYDVVTVSTDFVTADVLVWKRYRQRAPGILELLLDANPHIAKLHALSPFLPVGTQVRIPIDPFILKGAPSARIMVKLWNKA